MAKPLDGTEFFQQLQHAIGRARSEADHCKNELTLLNDRLDELIGRKGETFVELARHYLPEVTKEAIENNFSEVRDELLEVLSRKQRHQSKLNERITEWQVSRDKLEAALADVTHQLNDITKQRDELEQKLADRLQNDAQFQDQSRDAIRTEQELILNRGRVQEIQREASEKLPAYENSALFHYLYSRGFATPDYSAFWPFSALDGWLADFIGFRQARQSYIFLHATPELVQAEVARRQEELKLLLVSVKRIEADTSREIGLDKVMLEGQRLGEERDDLVKQLGENHEQLAACQQEQSDLNRSQGAFYEQAIERFKELLEKTETAVLAQRAEKTADSTDDEIVAELKWLDDEISDIRLNSPHATDKYEQAESRVSGLNYVMRRCRQSNFDSDRSYFVEHLDVSDAIDEYFDGELNQFKLLRKFRKHQRFHPTWSEQAAEKIGTSLESETSQAVMMSVAAVAGSVLQSWLKSGGAVDNRNRKNTRGKFTKGPGF